MDTKVAPPGGGVGGGPIPTAPPPGPGGVPPVIPGIFFGPPPQLVKDAQLKQSLENCRKRAQELLGRIEMLANIQLDFQSPNGWPDIVGKFVVLAGTQYQTLQMEIENITKEYLIKPISLYNIEPDAIPELLRTKLEPEIEKEQKKLVDDFTKNEQLNSQEYEANIDALRVSIENYNKMLDGLSQNFTENESKIIQATKKELISNKVVMPDVTEKLIRYYSAVNNGVGLSVRIEAEPKEVENIAVRVKQPQTEREKQLELLNKSKNRMKLKKEEEEAKAAQAAAGTAPNPVPSVTPTTTLTTPVPAPIAPHTLASGASKNIAAPPISNSSHLVNKTSGPTAPTPITPFTQPQNNRNQYPYLIPGSSMARPVVGNFMGPRSVLGQPSMPMMQPGGGMLTGGGTVPGGGPGGLLPTTIQAGMGLPAGLGAMGGGITGGMGPLGGAIGGLNMQMQGLPMAGNLPMTAPLMQMQPLHGLNIPGGVGMGGMGGMGMGIGMGGMPASLQMQQGGAPPGAPNTGAGPPAMHQPQQFMRQPGQSKGKR